MVASKSKEMVGRSRSCNVFRIFRAANAARAKVLKDGEKRIDGMLGLEGLICLRRMSEGGVRGSACVEKSSGDRNGRSD